MTRSQAARAAVAVLLAAAGLIWMHSFAPLQAPSVLVYAGIVTFLCGLVSALLPPAWSGFRKRIHGPLLGLLAGAILLTAGVLWPVRPFTVSSPSSRLDAFLPVCDFHEHHETLVQAPPERVWEAVNRVSDADLAGMAFLSRIRSAAMGNFRKLPAPTAVPMLDMIRKARTGFFVLDETPREFVFGLAGQPWNNRGVRLKSEEFRAWAPPGHVKIAANFLIEDAGNGRTRVITETRVAATDASARRTMSRYWALVYPGSGMIRRGLLNAIQRRAETR